MLFKPRLGYFCANHSEEIKQDTLDVHFAILTRPIAPKQPYYLALGDECPEFTSRFVATPQTVLTPRAIGRQ